eukprot:6200788-Pleurochrysis_carterae.AAC.1
MIPRSGEASRRASSQRAPALASFLPYKVHTYFLACYPAATNDSNLPARLPVCIALLIVPSRSDSCDKQSAASLCISPPRPQTQRSDGKAYSKPAFKRATNAHV